MELTALSSVNNIGRYTTEIPCLACGAVKSRPAFARKNDEHLSRLGASDLSVRYRICESCGLVFQNPRITREVEALLYADGGYHGFGESGPPSDYLERHLRFAEREVRWIRDVLGVESGEGRPALDIGAGAGFGVVALERAGWHASGVEPDRQLAAFGRSHYGVDIVSDFFNDHTVPVGNFSLIFSYQTFEHLLEPRAVLETARRKIAPDGYLYINVPTFRRCRQKLSWKWFNASHVCLFTHKSLGNLLTMTGFEMVRFDYLSDGQLRVLARPNTGPTTTLPYREKSWLVPLEIHLQGFQYAIARSAHVIPFVRRRLAKMWAPGKKPIADR